jgi:hypothetical protein
MTLCLLALPTKAEYRAYQYVIKNKVKIQDAPEGHIITSTFDPVSFVAYHGGHKLISIDLLRTWICPGHTGYRRPICESPYGKLPAGVIE